MFKICLFQSFGSSENPPRGPFLTFGSSENPPQGSFLTFGSSENLPRGSFPTFGSSENLPQGSFPTFGSSDASPPPRTIAPCSDAERECLNVYKLVGWLSDRIHHRSYDTLRPNILCHRLLSNHHICHSNLLRCFEQHHFLS